VCNCSTDSAPMSASRMKQAKSILSHVLCPTCQMLSQCKLVCDTSSLSVAVLACRVCLCKEHVGDMDCCAIVHEANVKEHKVDARGAHLRPIGAS